jgi:pimeloyl-ACP methyl ester carboxylesterase
MPEDDPYLPLRLPASIQARWYPAAAARGVAVLFGGVGGGFDTPAGGLYVRLGRHLPQDGVSVLRVRFRRPGELDDCVADVLEAVAWAEVQGLSRFGLVGHSFGGAVAITAASRRPEATAAVIALSTQSYGTDGIAALRDRPVLLIHGVEDEVLPAACSSEVYQRAGPGAQLELIPGAHHMLDEAADEVFRLCHGWLVDHLGPEDRRAPATP